MNTISSILIFISRIQEDYQYTTNQSTGIFEEAKAMARIYRAIETARWYITNIHHRRKVELFWWRDFPNVGDRVSPHLVKSLSGAGVLPAKSKAKNKLLSCGSILHHAEDGDAIWGTGLISTTKLLKSRNIHVYSIRGPLTGEYLRKQSIDCPALYGDPGLLLPHVFPRTTFTKRWKLGIVPHYADLKGFTCSDPDIKVLDVRKPILEYLMELWQCERIVSSSLHGIVFAESYGIPADWIKISSNVLGGRFKFDDYYMGTGRDPIDPLSLSQINRDRPWTSPRINDEALIGALKDAVLKA